ncbi:hypothetical protein MMC13_000123 [Lambiella insularis]|nr:hypothetical protein [Lambiella insularis]
MLFPTTALTLLAAGLSTAAPVEKRIAYPAPPGGDGTILNYALTLEYLERKFYMEGLANYTHADFVAAGFADPFYANLQEIYHDEQTHVAFLSGALTAAGITPTVELVYCFPSTDVLSFVSLSSVLEGVGVSAYLGAAASIMDKDYITAAGSILTVESRHSAYIRSELGESPFPFPFDTPLDFDEVYSLASAFICGGSSPVTLPFKAFPPLTLQCTQYYYEANRSSLTFHDAYASASSTFGITPTTPIYAVFFSGLQQLPVQVYIPDGGKDYKVAALPAGIAGQVYVVLSKSDTDFSDENIIAGPAILEVYPKGMAPSAPHAKCS